MAGYIGTKAVNLSTTGADINGNANVDGTLDVSGTTTLASVDINGGTIDGTSIGSAARSTGLFTTVNSSGLTTVASLLATTADINGGTIDGTPIGNASASTARFGAASQFVLLTNRTTTVGTSALWQYESVTVGSISVTASATTYNTTSDYRTKENITPVQGPVELIRALNPITYTAISDGQWYDGFLAHEVQQIIPTAVTGELDGIKEEEYEVTPAVEATFDAEGVELTPAEPAVMGTRTVPDMQSMDYSRLTPVLTAALQEALNKIDELTARIEALEAV
jgi:hypothetical protein